jgi:hypothetical protein
MAKGKKSSGSHANERSRINPLTGEREKVGGTKAGRKRNRLSWGDPLRTHDRPKKRVSVSDGE